MADLPTIEISGAAPAPPAPEPETASPPAQAISIEPGYVALASGDGTVENIPVENYGKALENGYRPATRGEVVRARDGFAGTVAAGAAAFNRGATFGLSDALSVGAGQLVGGDQAAERVREGLSEDIEAHPTVSAVGEIGGSLLPLALGAPPITAEAEGAGLLARAAQAAPRLFAEGIPFGLGHQLTEDVLGNHKMVASKYVSAGLEGGVLNLLLGSALHLAGGAVTDRLAARGARSLERAVVTEGERAAETAGLGERAIDRIRATAEEQAAKGAMPSATLGASDLAKLGRTTEDQQIRLRQIGRTLLDEGITTPGASKVVQSQRLAAKIETTSEELGALRKRFESTPVRPDAENTMRRIVQEVVQPLMSKPFSAPEYRSLEPYLDEITRTLKSGPDGEWGTSFEDLFTLRRELDKKLDPKLWQKVPGTAPAAFEELGKIRGILESEYEAAADRAANHLGEDISTEYKVKKALFGDLKTAERWAKKGAARETQNRAISLTDTIMAGAGIASGHGALAVGGAIANKALRQYGNQAAAYALDRIAKLEVLQRAAAAFDTKLAASTKAFFGHGEPPPRTRTRRAPITPAERVALRTAIREPAALAEHVADRLANEGMRDAAPNVVGAASQLVMRAAQYAASTLPQEPRRIGPARGEERPRKLGLRGEAELTRALDALDTDKLLDDLARGRLSRQQIEAVKLVDPDAFYAIRKSFRDYLQENSPEISVQQDVALSIVLDTPVSSYTRGATIRGFQEAFVQGAPSADPRQAGESTEKIGSGRSKAAESLASPTDRAEANGEL